MRTSLVDTRNQQTDTVGALSVVLRVDLGFIGDSVDDACDGDRTVVEQARGHGLLSHEVGEDTGVGGETGKRYTEVSVDANDLLLVGAELFGITLQQVLGTRQVGEEPWRLP